MSGPLSFPAADALLSSGHDHHRPVEGRRDGRHPQRGRDDIPRLGTPCGGGLRHRHVRRLGGRPDPAEARRRRHDRHLVRGCPRRRARDGVPVHDPDEGRRPVADGPVRPPGDQLGRQQHRLRPGRLRLGRRRLRDADVGRPRHLRDAHRDVRRARPTRWAPSTARAGGSAISSTSACRRSRSCRRSSSPATSRGATTRPTCSRSSRPTAAPMRSRRSCARRMRRGIAVIVDVVYNHLGPSDLDLWRFDGWGEGDGGGIYFYNDIRGVTLWGATRPDYGRGEVRTFLRDSAMTWLEEFRCDGLRFDSTVHMRTTEGYPACRARLPSPTAGRSSPGSTTRSRLASRGRSRSPRTSRTTRSS